jgi:hypothetical protein
LVGGLLSVVVAVNLVIYLGVEGGYESTLGDVFAHSPLTGILVVGVLAAGPVIGVIVARRGPGKPVGRL